MIVTHGSVRFIDIPVYFLEKYSKEIVAWSDHLRQIGLVKSFVLNEGYLSDLSPDPELGAVLLQVKLQCRPWVGGVEISPLEEQDREMIAQHCAKLQKAGIPSDAYLQEPARPWVPFMPGHVVKQ